MDRRTPSSCGHALGVLVQRVGDRHDLGARDAVASSRACVEPISPAPITPTFTIPRAPAASGGWRPGRRRGARSRPRRRARGPARRRPSRRSRSPRRRGRTPPDRRRPAPSAQNSPRRQAVSVSARSALTPASTSSRTSLMWIASIRSPQSLERLHRIAAGDERGGALSSRSVDVGVLEELLDLRDALDVGRRVVVEDRLEAALAGRVGGARRCRRPGRASATRRAAATGRRRRGPGWRSAPARPRRTAPAGRCVASPKRSSVACSSVKPASGSLNGDLDEAADQSSALPRSSGDRDSRAARARSPRTRRRPSPPARAAGSGTGNSVPTVISNAP